MKLEYTAACIAAVQEAILLRRFFKCLHAMTRANKIAIVYCDSTARTFDMLPKL